MKGNVFALLFVKKIEAGTYFVEMKLLIE